MKPYKDPQNTAVSALGVPLRKRTVRACDQCRRRKTKCNGEDCCKSCDSIGLQCSYGQRIKQARGPRYIAHLEKRIEDLESEARGRRKSDSSNSESSEDTTTASQVSPKSLLERRLAGNNAMNSTGSSESDSGHSLASNNSISPIQPSSFAPHASVHKWYGPTHSIPPPNTPANLTNNLPWSNMEFDSFNFDPLVPEMGEPVSATSLPPLWPMYNYSDYAMPSYASKHWSQ